MHLSRTGLAIALASLSVAALACSGGRPANDASTGGDATTFSDAAPSDGVGDTNTTPGDGKAEMLDAGSGDAREASEAGPVDGPADLCAAKICGRNEVCDPTDGACRCAGTNGTCVTACSSPLAPDLSIIADSETLLFVVSDGSPIELAVLPATASIATATFQPGSSISLGGFSGLTRVLARTTAPGCDANVFDAVYDVRATYAPAPPDAMTTAVSYDDPRIVEWAQGCASYLPGAGATNAQFMMPNRALGPAGTDPLDVVALGNGGSITLTFGAPIADGAGWDFAVYENSFTKDAFLELGFVEVSSDGVHFARFDSAFRGTTQPCGNCSGTAAQIGGLAGAYMVGYGTPFDLAALANSPPVRDGAVDLRSIEYVRIVDVVGDGTTFDSFGRAIIDPLSDGPTAGFDLDGIAVLNQRE